jgi:hypothetical protein
MSPDTLAHPETGEVYHKPFRIEDTPFPDILAMLALGGALLVLTLIHTHPISGAWPSPVALPYVQLAEDIMGVGATASQALPTTSGIFPFYSYLIAALMALKGSTDFATYHPWLLGLNVTAFILSMMILYHTFRQGLSYLPSLLLVLLIACSPLTLTTVTALSPAPLLWFASLSLLFLLQFLQVKNNLFFLMLGSVMALFAGMMHPYGLCVLGAWNISLLCLGYVGVPLFSTALTFLLGATLPHVSLLAGMSQPFSYTPTAVDGISATSILAPLPERIQGFFSGLHQFGKVLLLAPDPNLQEWPMQDAQDSWFASLLNQAYLGLSGLAILAWPLGVLFAVVAMIKAVYTFVKDREVVGALFLSWTLCFAVVFNVLMPKLVMGSLLSMAFLLPTVFVFAFIGLKSIAQVPLLKWMNPVLRYGVVGLATLCVGLFQARVGYNELASIYDPRAVEVVAPSQVLVAVEAPETGQRPASSLSKKNKGYALLSVGSMAQEGQSSASNLASQASSASVSSLQSWVSRRVAPHDCFLSHSPVKDSYQVGRPVYRLGSPYAETGLMGVDVAASGFACAYFIEHKAKRHEYDWIRQEQFRRPGVRIVFEDGKAQGLRIWRLRPS